MIIKVDGRNFWSKMELFYSSLTGEDMASKDKKIGLKLIERKSGFLFFEVIDKELLFVNGIKHGLEFTKVE